ncbi:GNAT family N-acetyltransferase [Dysgonomonas sp. 520]|uniref:GNAT family N-acetyltransferase n=1 Tax=Dysgonomonas sp. 520 TaxID=2302931 RepID=UPI0013D569E4|nr:GNAT family N-acetyltransferase [Dysgonomonas sp. 520]NDW09339.1 N-acetyltransferase [Dysgonomonas sp. 520]
MYLENSILKLRAVEPEDLDVLYSWENISSLWKHGNTLAPYSKLSLRQYINDSLSMDIFQSRQLRLMVVLKNSGVAIGTVDLYDFDPHNERAGIGILVDENHRGQKYASEILQIIQDYAFNFLHLHQLYAHIGTNNEISINLFSKAGYKEAGRLKDWVSTDKKTEYEDVLVMQLFACE